MGGKLEQGGREAGDAPPKPLNERAIQRLTVEVADN